MRNLFGLLLLLRLVQDTALANSKQDKLFYIYDWPDVIKRQKTLRADEGTGKLLHNASVGLYNTDQFHLFRIMYHRALKDPRRTLNPDLATSFLIPYDFYPDVMYEVGSDLKQTWSWFGVLEQAPVVTQLLKDSPYFQRNQGADHLLIVSWSAEYDTLIIRTRSIPLFELCQRCLKLTVEDFSFLFPPSLRSKQRQIKGDNWLVVPYPSNFHWSPAVQRPFIWEVRSERQYLACNIGSADSSNLLASMLRKELRNFCLFNPSCKFISYSADHNSGLIEDSARDPHFLYSMHSIFCFQPLGDTIPRKGIFDSLSFGCIPVVFHPLSTSGMYTHHWPSELWKQIVVEIEVNLDAMNYKTGLTLAGKHILKGNPLDILEALAKRPKEIAKRQRLIREHIFELQYGLSGYEKGSTWPLNAHGAPMLDAYDRTMDLVFGAHAGKRARQAPKEDDSTLMKWRNELPYMISPHFNLSLFVNETSPLEYGESLNIVFKQFMLY